MPENRDTHSDRVCDVCGHIGWEEAISACCQCTIRRHGYCMRVVVMNVLKDWVCEDCLLGNNVDSLKSGRTEDVPNNSRKVCLALRRRVAHRGQKTVETGKVKFLPTEEVIKLSSGSTKNEFSSMSNLRSKHEPVKFTASPSKRTFMESKTVVPCMSPIRVRPNPSFLPLGSMKPPGFAGAQSSSISQHVAKNLKESKEEKAPQPLAKKCSRNEEPHSSVMSAKEVKTANSDAKTLHIMKGTLSMSATSTPCLPIINARKKEEKATQPLAKKCSRNEEPLSSVMSAKEVKTANADANTLNIMKGTLSTSATSTPCLSIINAGKKVESASVVSHKENVRKEPILDVIPLTILHTKSEEALKSSRPTPSRFHTIIADSGQNFYDASEPKNSNVAKRETCNNQLKVSLYRPHVPAPYIIWRGGFKFLDTATPGKFYGGFLAQHPCVVHRQAYELSENMPPVLQVNLLEQCYLPEDLFQNGCLDLCDIALYIFPADYIERSLQNYGQLSQLMEINNSVMRSDMDGVELLIFTSKQLQGDSRDMFSRSNTDFLCGVFRRAKGNQMKEHQKLPSLLSSLDNGEAASMDIDMVGGQVVGIPDMAVSKKSNGDLSKRAAKESLNVITDRKLSAVSGGSDFMIQPISVDLDSTIQPISVEFKQEYCKDSDLPCKSTTQIISRFTLEHPLESSCMFPGSMPETGIAPAFEGMLKLPSSNRAPKAPRGEEKKDLGERQIMSQLKEEIDCQGILQVAYGVSSPQPAGTIEDSGLQGSKKHSQVLVDDLVNDCYAACLPPPFLSPKGTKVGSVIKAEGGDNEKPFETREKKGVQVLPFFGKDQSRILAAAVCGPCPVEVKAEVPEVVNNCSAACPPHLLDNGTKIGLEVQGHGIGKPIETREEEGLQGSSFLSKDKFKSVTSSFYASCAGEVKAEMKKVKNDGANTNAALASNMVTSTRVASTRVASTRVKLSVAGRARGNPGAASAGGLLRDESGKWIVGYNLKLGLCTSLATDLWALFQGIRLTWDEGYRKVVVELDSIAAVECLKKPLSLADSNRHLIESCRDLLNCKWDCKISTITREENSCANWLAANVEDDRWGFSIIKEPPLKLIPLLENDCKRLPQTHDSQFSISKSP